MSERECIRPRPGCRVKLVAVAQPHSSQAHHGQVGAPVDEMAASSLVARYSIWLGAKPVNDGLPFTFSSGARLGAFVARCAMCSARVASEDLRGVVKEVRKDVLLMRGHGLCRSCSCVTIYSQRVSDIDGHLWAEHGDDPPGSRAGGALEWMISCFAEACMPLREAVSELLERLGRSRIT